MRLFQRFVQCLRLIRKHKILLYLDDILIATENLEHLEILSKLFELVDKSHLRFRLDKCYFAQTKIKFPECIVTSITRY